MNQDILLSKIVPNATDTSWAQAYTTLNVYMALSIEKPESKSPVTPFGKELLEKLQREFFALDEKTLDNIKKAVSNATKSIEGEYKYSIIIGAIVGEILYIVIASEGRVVIKRGDKVGVVATGIEGELHGFSGKLRHDDIILLETGDFAKKMPLDGLTEQLASNDVLQIAETITPLIHGDSKGTEGAIILQFKSMDVKEDKVIEDPTMEDSLEMASDEKDEQEDISPEKENLWTKAPAETDTGNAELHDSYEDASYDEEKKSRLPSFSLPKINFFNKKILIGGAILVLIAVLVGGIAFQTIKSNEAKKEAEFSKIFDPIKSRFDEAAELESLNKTLALEEFSKLNADVDAALQKYSEDSNEYKDLSGLKSQIQEKISGLGGGGSAKNIKEFVKTGSEIKSITAITAKGGTLLLLDKTGKQVITIDDDGTIGKTYDINSSDNFISADDKYIYTMGEGVKSIDRGNGNINDVMDDIEGSAFDIFGSNLYTLTNNDILKYRSPAYEGVTYFTKEPSFKSTPVDMSIAGPIYILSEKGDIQSFTKGAEDDFELTGLASPFGPGAKIYAEPELDNIYVLDVKNQRVVVISGEGDYVTQYEGSFIEDANSFAIDEENEIGYVLSGNIVYSFNL